MIIGEWYVWKLIKTYYANSYQEKQFRYIPLDVRWNFYDVPQAQ